MARMYTQAGVGITLSPQKRSVWVDALVFLGLILLVYLIVLMAMRWHTPIATKFSINLSPGMLPYYAVLSTSRMAVAYIVALVFSLIYARLAVRSKRIEGILIPILDILQSIPILSFMPGVVLGLSALFPGSSIGLELAAVLLIFTSQAWNITFGFYQTLLTIPAELKEVAAISGIGFWNTFTRLEVPSGVISIVWNSMMSWAGGWFFLMASEQFTLGNKSFQLPGLGSYLQAAANKGDITDLLLGLGMLILVIVALDQLLWRPLVAWSDKFKIEQNEAGDKPQAWMLTLLRESFVIQFLVQKMVRPIWVKIDTTIGKVSASRSKVHNSFTQREHAIAKIIWTCISVILIGALLGGAFAALDIFRFLSASEWKMLGIGAGATLLRTLAALLISLLWTVPVGVAIGLHPVWSKKLLPIVQLAASIPATALFPALLLIFLMLPGGLDIAAVILMLLGTQWYLLFNIIAGAMAIPNDLKEASEIYHITGFRQWKILILPAIFPYLVTGMITATGGAWNASIVAEYASFAGKVHQTVGLGDIIASAANQSNFPLLLAGTVTMALVVFSINRLFWQRIYHLAENRFHFE